MKRYERSYAIGQPFSNITTHKTDFGTYKSGVYISELGVCHLYSQQWSDGRYTLNIDVYRDGVGHYLSLERKQEFSDRSMAIFAGKFQRKVHSNKKK